MNPEPVNTDVRLWWVRWGAAGGCWGGASVRGEAVAPPKCALDRRLSSFLTALGAIGMDVES